VFINGQLVRGNIDKLNVFDEICKAFESPKEYCNAIIHEEDPEKWNVDIVTGKIKDAILIQDDSKNPV